MAKSKFGIFYDVYPRSDLEFMRELSFDPGDGRGSYTHRDKMLMIQLKAAGRGDRGALIWLIKHLTWESKARMTMLKKHQTIYIRENPHFASPAPALEILGIGGLMVVDFDMGAWLSPESEDPESKQFQWNLPVETEEWRKIKNPVVGYLEPWFLEAALARMKFPQYARRQIEAWLGNGAFQPLHQQAKGLPPNPLIELDRPRRSREDCWFKPGQSPNPKGRPKGCRNKSKRGRVEFFDEPVTVTIDGKKRRLKRREAFLRQIEARAIAEQDHQVLRLLADRHIVMSKLQATVPYDKLETFARSIGGIRPNSLEGAIHSLGGGDLVYANSPTARMLLEPWLIEMGLRRLGERRLSYAEQRIVLMFARHPRRTMWPDWWAPDLRFRKGREPKQG